MFVCFVSSEYLVWFVYNSDFGIFVRFVCVFVFCILGIGRFVGWIFIDI